MTSSPPSLWSQEVIFQNCFPNSHSGSPVILITLVFDSQSNLIILVTQPTHLAPYLPQFGVFCLCDSTLLSILFGLTTNGITYDEVPLLSQAGRGQQVIHLSQVWQPLLPEFQGDTVYLEEESGV